jgi:hypothetical protein
MEFKNRYENIMFLKPTDEVKFVIGSRKITLVKEQDSGI